MFMKHTGILDGLGHQVIVPVDSTDFTVVWQPRGWASATQSEYDTYMGSPTPDTGFVTEAELSVVLAAQIAAAVAALVNGAPGALDTLNELAVQLQADEGTAATLAALVGTKMPVVVHGATASTARPTSTVPVLWVGSVTPTNATNNDLLVDTATPAFKVRLAGSFTTLGGGGGGTSLTPTAVKTSAYSAAVGDLVPANATTAGFTVTLPTAPATGAQIGVYKYDATGNIVTVNPGGGGTIDGQSSATIVTQNAGATLEHLGSNDWKVVATYSTSGPAGPTGPTGPTGGSGVMGIFAAGVLNSWYPVVGVPVGSSSSQAMGAVGTAIVGTPFIAQETMTIDALGCYVGTANAGSVVRLGLLTPRASNPYRLALSSVYADRLVEAAATVDCSTTGAKTALLSTPLVIPAGTAFAGIAVVQGVTCSLWAESNSALSNSPWGQVGDLIENGQRLAVTATGMTSGAIPATFTPTGYRTSGVGGCVWFRRTA